MKYGALLFGVVISILLGSCVTADAPRGVPRGIAFNVTSVLPKSFDIVAFGSRTFDALELRDAWSKKAIQVAAGRKFTASLLVVRDTEGPGGGIPILGRSVGGSITLSD